MLVVVDEPLADGRLDFGPRHFFLATNLPPEQFDATALLELYRQRGTFEDRLGEWNGLRVNLSQALYTMIVDAINYNRLI